MPYETGSYSTPKVLFDRIGAQVQATAFMGAGNEWTLAYSFDGWGSADANVNKVIKTFLCPGPTLGGDWYVTLRIQPSTGLNTTNFLLGAIKSGAVPPYGGATWSDAGTWSSASVGYTRGQVVKQSTTYYVCDVNHTSAAGNQPGTGGAAGIWYSLGSTPDWMGTFLGATDSHSLGYGKVWNGGPGDITYWLVANAGRVWWVMRSDTRYHFAHAGGLVRFGPASESPLPTLLCANHTTESTVYSDTGGNMHNFPLAGSESSSHAVSLHGRGVNAFSTDSSVFAFPPGHNSAFAAPLAPLGRRPNGDFPLMPVMVGRAGSGVMGTMDGVFVTDIRDSASGNIITVGADNYLVIEDVFRGQGGQFLALKLA